MWLPEMRLADAGSAEWPGCVRTMDSEFSTQSLSAKLTPRSGRDYALDSSAKLTKKRTACASIDSVPIGDPESNMRERSPRTIPMDRLCCENARTGSVRDSTTRFAA